MVTLFVFILSLVLLFLAYAIGKGWILKKLPKKKDFIIVGYVLGVVYMIGAIYSFIVEVL